MSHATCHYFYSIVSFRFFVIFLIALGVTHTMTTSTKAAEIGLVVGSHSSAHSCQRKGEDARNVESELLFRCSFGVCGCIGGDNGVSPALCISWVYEVRGIGYQTRRNGVHIYRGDCKKLLFSDSFILSIPLRFSKPPLAQNLTKSYIFTSS